MLTPAMFKLVNHHELKNAGTTMVNRASYTLDLQWQHQFDNRQAVEKCRDQELLGMLDEVCLIFFD